jgi:hypothetical protein
MTQCQLQFVNNSKKMEKQNRTVFKDREKQAIDCVRFIKYDIQVVFLKCAEILPTRLWDNVED